MRALHTYLGSSKQLFFPQRRIFFAATYDAEGMPQAAKVNDDSRAKDAVHFSYGNAFRTVDSLYGRAPTPHEVMQDALGILENQAAPFGHHRVDGLRTRLSGAGATNADLARDFFEIEERDIQRAEAVRHEFHAMHERSEDLRAGNRSKILDVVFARENNARIRGVRESEAHIEHDEQWQQEAHESRLDEAHDVRFSAAASIEGLRQNPDINWVFNAAGWERGGMLSSARDLWQNMDRMNPAPATVVDRMVRLQQYVVLTELLRPDQLALIKNGELSENNPEHTDILLLLIQFADGTYNQQRMFAERFTAMNDADALMIINDLAMNPHGRLPGARPGANQMLAIELSCFDPDTGRPRLDRILGSGNSVFTRMAKEKGGMVDVQAEEKQTAALKKVAELKFQLGSDLTPAEEATLSHADRARLRHPVKVDPATGASYTDLTCRHNPSGIGARIDAVSGATADAIDDRIADIGLAKQAFDTAARKQAELDSLDPIPVLNREATRLRAEIAALPIGAPTTPAERAALQQQLTNVQQNLLRHRSLRADIIAAWRDVDRFGSAPGPAPIAPIRVVPPAFDLGFGRDLDVALRVANRAKTNVSNVATDANKTERTRLQGELKTAEDELKAATEAATAARTNHESLAIGAGAPAADILLAVFAEEQTRDRKMTPEQAQKAAKLKLNRMRAATFNQRAMQEAIRTLERIDDAERREGSRLATAGRVGKGAAKGALVGGLIGGALFGPAGLAVVGAGLGLVRGAYGAEAAHEADQTLRSQEVLQKFFAGETGETVHDDHGHGHGHDAHAEHAHHDTTKYDHVIESMHSLVRFQTLVHNGEISLKELAGLHTLTEEALNTNRLPPADVTLYTRLRRFAWITLVQEQDGVQPALDFIKANGQAGLYGKLSYRAPKANVVLKKGKEYTKATGGFLKKCFSTAIGKGGSHGGGGGHGH